MMAHELLEIAENAQAAATACAAALLEEIRSVLANSPVARIAISGGSTPKLMFEVLAKTPFSWAQVHIFWVDERCVPPTHPESNYKLAAETFLQPAGVPAENIHRIQGELDPSEAAARYADDIRQSFGLREGELPAFDVIHRGMGDDAHTASLFPGEPLIADRMGIAAGLYVEKMKMHRVTLLPGVLLAGKKTFMLAAGAGKAEPLFEVLRGPLDPFRFPCQLATRGAGNAVWFIDRPAAAKLS
jgi:6-phosphogluconolactonase